VDPFYNLLIFSFMTNEIAEIVEKLQLLPHPEGGFYSETYRSPATLTDMDRSLMTCIYFLLTSENPSRFHRIKSDEMWFFHAGSALTVHTLDDRGHRENQLGLDLSKGELPQLLVPKNTIFGSSVAGENNFALVSCVVAPGFDFADFELFTRQTLLEWYPNEERIISQLT
jgi:predicted cupin superfamily sugar epimerase